MNEKTSEDYVKSMESMERDFKEIQQLLMKSRADMQKLEAEVMALYECAGKDQKAAQALARIAACFADSFGGEAQIEARRMGLEARMKEMSLQLAQERNRNTQGGEHAANAGRASKEKLIRRRLV